jgi:hypothetical protein
MMNDSTRVMRRPRPAWPRTARSAAAIIAAAALALLAAACSDSPSSAGSGGSPTAAGPAHSPSAVAFSHCMRSQGVPNFPDPGRGGVLAKTNPQRLGVSSSKFQGAQRACQHLLPITRTSIEQCEAAGVCSQAVTQQMLSAGLRFARCMRSHGVPNWPDPSTDSQGRVAFAISVSKDGFDPHSAQIGTKMNECDHLMPGGGVPLAVSS